MRPDQVDLIRLQLALREHRRRKNDNTVRPQDIRRVARELWNLRKRFDLIERNDLLFIAQLLEVQVQDLIEFDSMVQKDTSMPPTKREPGSS